MAARKFAPRKSLRDTLAENNAADRYYAAMHGKEPMVQSQIAPKRVYKKRTEDEDTEAAVMREVTQIVAGHRNVIWALRANSGMIYNEGGAPVWFYRWIKNNDDMTLTDIWGLARFGLFALEAKHRQWHYTGTPREKAQDAFIQAIRAAGGRGGFVTCAEQAIEILK
jgi:hypothetical protein